MKYSISEEKILILSPSLINIPKDDLRFLHIKEDEKNIQKYINLEDILPKGYIVKNNKVYVKDIKIPNKILLAYKDQLEELKNHLFDHFESFDDLIDKHFLDLEGEVLVSKHVSIVSFRQKDKKEKIKIKKILTQDNNLSEIVHIFNAEQLEIIKNQNLENYNNLIPLYEFYFTNKQSKFIKAIQKSELSKLDWESLFSLFNHKKIEYPSKLTNLRILLKMYQNQKEFKNEYADYDLLYKVHKKFYDKENSVIEGYKINFIKNRADLPLLASIFNNCIRSKKSSLINKSSIFFTLTKNQEFAVGEFNQSEGYMVDFDTKNFTSDSRKYIKNKVKNFLNNI